MRLRVSRPHYNHPHQNSSGHTPSHTLRKKIGLSKAKIEVYGPFIKIECPAVRHADDLGVRGQGPGVHGAAPDHHGLASIS